ncbi:MAG: radical SAM protein [Spirochaetales bacterium]|nr:radical SAM protein [Spirochaetales bacterium]
MNIISKLRFFASMAGNAGKYNVQLFRITNKRFANNKDKIIGWYNGLPSFFLLAPPLFSAPSANSLTSRIMSVFAWEPRPDMVNFAITNACQCSCSHCSLVKTSGVLLLSTGEIVDALRQVQDLGVATIAFVGGEPLLHPDIIPIVESVDKERSQVLLFTNGLRLEELAVPLKKAGLTSIIVSIDSPDADSHDKVKGLKGVFGAVVNGIKKARKAGLLVGTSSVIYKDDMSNGKLEQLFDLGKELKVNEMIFFDAIPAGNFMNRQDLEWSRDDLNSLIQKCEMYQSRKKYPGLFPYAFMKSPESLGCSGGKSYFYISPYGEVCPCDFLPISVGNVKDTPLSQLWREFQRRPELACSSPNCKMQNPEFKEKVKHLFPIGSYGKNN